MCTADVCFDVILGLLLKNDILLGFFAADGVKVGVNDFIVRAAAVSLQVANFQTRLKAHLFRPAYPSRTVILVVGGLIMPWI